MSLSSKFRRKSKEKKTARADALQRLSWEEIGAAELPTELTSRAAAFELGFRANQFEWLSAASIAFPSAWKRSLKTVIPWLIERVAFALNRVTPGEDCSVANEQIQR